MTESQEAMPSGGVVIATHNQGKLREFRQLLEKAMPNFDAERYVFDAKSVNAPDVKETGVTFAENAILKAEAVAKATGLPAVSDDSGLAVEVLNGAPGIFSARWSGAHGDDQANLELLLNQLADISEEHRAAKFVCAAALAVPGQETVVTFGELKGTLLTAPRGDGGFGYDPILLPEGYDRSVAELTAEEKNSMSHRAQAFAGLVPHVQRVLQDQAAPHSAAER